MNGKLGGSFRASPVDDSPSVDSAWWRTIDNDSADELTWADSKSKCLLILDLNSAEIRRWWKLVEINANTEGKTFPIFAIDVFNGTQLTHLYRRLFVKIFINFHQTINLSDLSMVKTCHWFRLEMFPGSTSTAGVLRDKIENFLWENNFLSTTFFRLFSVPPSDRVDDLFAFENWYEFRREEEWKEFNYAMKVNN